MSTTLDTVVQIPERGLRLTGCRSATTTLDRVVPNPEIPFHPTVPNVGLDFDRAVGIPVDQHMAVFIPAVGLFGPCSDLGCLLRSPRVCGVIINCVSEVWIVESEPTLGNAFGVRVNTERGKCVMSGQGTVSNPEDARGVAAPAVKFAVKTVYDNVGSQRRSATVGGGATNTGWEVHGSVTWTF